MTKGEMCGASEAPKPELFTKEQICQVLQVSTATLDRLRSKGAPVTYVLESPRFRKTAILEWLEAQSAKRAERDGA